ncbi:cell division cycle- protein [Ceratobasidium sp. 392]|nr:cell division cycle- protein [Ceratobasidium sp. 392]
MASAFLLSSNAPASSSVFTIRPRSSSKSSFTYAAPRTRSPQFPTISEPQHNDRFIDGDAPFLTDVECDLDISFASNMSIGSAPSSPPVRPGDLPATSYFLIPPQTLRAPSSPVPMDISPAPRRIASTVRVTSPSARTSGKSGRALVQELFRGFGHDVANLANNPPSSSLLGAPSTLKLARSNSPPRSQRSATASKSNNTSRTRSALPSAWLQNVESSPVPDQESATPVRPKLGRNRSQTMIDPRQNSTVGVEEPSRQQQQQPPAVAWDASISYDDMDVEAMDIDGDVSISHSVTAPSSPAAGPLPSELNELFFQPSSPVLEASSPSARTTLEHHSPEPEEFVEFDLEEEIAHQEELRRSEQVPSPEKPAIFSSSPPTSPSRPIRPGPGIGLGRPFERSATTGGQGSLFGSLSAQAQAALPKRTLAPRRPALSNHSYPKVHYPEVYVMAGGFSQYFKEKPSQVMPPYSYVRMDDPVHLRARHSDLNNFRRWERTKSYTYGEKQAAAAAIAQGQRSASGGSSHSSKNHPNRSSAPVSGTSSSSSSLSRRMGHAMGHAASLSTLDEDGDSIDHGLDNEISPCPPSAVNYLRPGLLGRAASFGFATTKR